MKWNPVNEPPFEASKDVTYETFDYLVTDGFNVGVGTFARGGGHVGKPWANWNEYGGIRGSTITHWMPLPAPPIQEGAS